MLGSLPPMHHDASRRHVRNHIDRVKVELNSLEQELKTLPQQAAQIANIERLKTELGLLEKNLLPNTPQYHHAGAGPISRL